LPYPDGRIEACYAVAMLHKMVQDHPYDMLPRIALLSPGRAGAACDSRFCTVMAGLEFMQQVIPRIPHAYTSKEQAEAKRRGEKLRPYSIMDVRRLEPLDHAARAADPEDAGSHARTYHFSFIQRRHRRRLAQPRKSDGVQVIRVAAGRK